MTIETGYDLTTHAGIATAKHDIDKADPDVLVFAWVCTPWSTMQNMNSRVPGHPEKLMRDKANHMKMLGFAEWCERRQSANGKLFLGENPLTSLAWQQPPCLRLSRRCYEAVLDQCMFNMRAPDNHMLVKKPTKILTTSKSAARNLSIRCDGTHEHRTIEGTVTYYKNGVKNTMSLSSYCGGYTKELAEAMVSGFEEDLSLISHLTNVVSRKRAMDELEEEAARRVAQRTEPASSSTDQRKRRREFMDELLDAMKRAKMPRPTTRSMKRAREAVPDEEDVPQLVKRAIRHWMDDMLEEIPYIESQARDQRAPEAQQEREQVPLLQQQGQRDEYIHQDQEETPYPHEARAQPQNDQEEIPVELYYPHDPPPQYQEREHIPGPPDAEHDDYDYGPGDHQQEPGEEVPQYVPPAGVARDEEMIPREEILREQDFWGNDLAGGEGDVPAVIVRDVPPEIRREVRNAHYNLGHPSTATLLRIMRRAGASDAVQRYARWWKCPQCAQRQAPGALQETAAPYRPRTFNLVVGCDMKVVHDAKGDIFYTLNIVDLCTTFQVLAMLDGCSAEECAEKFWLWWVVWAGPPKTMVTDMGTSFLAAFLTLAERYSATSRVIPTEAPWQIGMVERHGGVLADVVNMTVAQTGATGKTEMMLVLIASAAAKNRRPGLSGHSPRAAVFGMDDRMDGSVIDSLLDGEQLPAHSQAASDTGYQRALKIRQEAMKAIVDIDHSQRYHRAIASRPSLQGHQVYLPGAQVYYWQAAGSKGKLKGRRRRQQDRWRGPGTVIGHEMRDGAQSNALWISHGGHLRLVAPQHVRPASPEEQISEHDSMRRLSSIIEEFSRSQLEFENLIGQDDPPTDGDGLRRDRASSRAASSREDPDPEADPDHLPDGRSRDEVERDLFGDYAEDDDAGYGHYNPSPEGPPAAYGPLGHSEEINVLRLKPTQKSKKGKELNARLFDNNEWEAFMKADADNWAKHLKHNAVTVLTPEEARKVPKENILPIVSRFVRTNKSEDPAVLEAASRLVVPGHLQEGASQEDGG